MTWWCWRLTTLGAGSGSLTLGASNNNGASSLKSSDGSFTIDASQSTQDGAINIANAYFQRFVTVLTGTKGDYDGGSATTLEGGDLTITQVGQKRSRFLLTQGWEHNDQYGRRVTFSQGCRWYGRGRLAGGLISIIGAADGSADISFAALSASAISIVMAGAGTFSAGSLDGTGGSANVSLSTINSGSVDVTIGGQIDSSGDVIFTLGANKGDLIMSGTSTTVLGGDFVIDGQNVFTGGIDIEGKVSASGVTITLGEAVTGHGFSASTIQTHGNFVRTQLNTRRILIFLMFYQLVACQ